MPRSPDPKFWGRSDPSEGADTVNGLKPLYGKVAVHRTATSLAFLQILETIASNSVASRPSLPARHRGTSLLRHCPGHLPWITACRRWLTGRTPKPKLRPAPYFLLISYKLRVESNSEQPAKNGPATFQPCQPISSKQING